MTEEIKDRIKNIDWFSKCGNDHVIVTSFDVYAINSWHDASEYFAQEIWEERTLEAQNNLTTFLHDRYRREYSSWNEKAKEGRDFIQEEVVPRLISIKEAHGLTDLFLDCVKWDILGAIMEDSFKNYRFKDEFFTKLLEIYEQGNFPCGWVISDNKGALVVY